MIRILFWIFVTLFLAAFFYFGAASQHWTDEEKSRFWTVAVCVPMTAMACGIGWYLIYALKKGVVVLAGKYGGRAFSRNSEPFYYWGIMLFYILFLTLLASGLTGAFLSLFGIEITSHKIKAGISLLFGCSLGFLFLIFPIGALRTGILKMGRDYERNANPIEYWFFSFFFFVLGLFFIAFGISQALHP
jgi:hypothetical protein